MPLGENRSRGNNYCVRSAPAHGIRHRGITNMGDLSATNHLLRRAADGDQEAVAALFAGHRDRLKQMVRLRMDRRLQGRIDPSDVLQETYLEAAHRVAEFAREPTTS